MDNFKDIYEGLGEQDKLEKKEEMMEMGMPQQQQMRMMNQLDEEDYSDESDVEMENCEQEEQIQPKQNSGLFGGIMNAFGGGAAEHRVFAGFTFPILSM